MTIMLLKELIAMDNTALVIAIIGALNWGSIGLFGIDLVAMLCGGQSAVLSRIIYTVVGIAGLWCITLPARARADDFPYRRRCCRRREFC